MRINPDIPNSLEIAHKRGIKIVWTIQKDSNAPHLIPKIAEEWTQDPSVWQEFPLVEISKLRSLTALSNMNTPTIIIVHQDVPGMIAHVTEALSFRQHRAVNVTREKLEKSHYDYRSR